MHNDGRKRTLSLAIAATWTFGLAGGLLVGLASAPGCKAAPCSTPKPNEPSSALECPAGQLCYLGECVRSCTAGQERVLECASDSDCGGALPRCVNEFCSACEGFETCVPELNLCQQVPDVEYPEPIDPPNTFMRPPYPLDAGAGQLDGSVFTFPGIKRNRDAGFEGPIEEPEITVAGYWDVYEEDDLRTGNAVRTSSSTLRVFDVSGVGRGLDWRADLAPPRIAEPLDTETVIEACVIRSFTSTTTVLGRPQVDLGDIMLTDYDTYDGMRDDLAAEYDPAGQRYVVTRDMNLPGRLLNHSILADPVQPLFVTLTAGGSNVTDGAWPDWEPGQFRGFHVPYELTPRGGTVGLMNAPIEVMRPALQDLTFTWDYVASGNDNFERVIVRVVGNQSEILCSDSEGQQGNAVIAVRTGVLDEFIRREGGGPATYRLIFERASAQSPLVIGVDGQLIQFSLRLRHSLVQTLRFL